MNIRTGNLPQGPKTNIVNPCKMGGERLRVVRTFGLALVAASLAISAAQAAIEMQLSGSYGGTPPDSTVKPWMDVVFQDIAPNTVRLTITAPNLTNPEFDQNINFNF